MTSNNNDLLLSLMEEAIDIISNMKGITVNPDELIDDVFALAKAFPTPPQFSKAVNQVLYSLERLIVGMVKGTALERNLTGWNSYHFQSDRKNGHPADLRIVYEEIDDFSILIHGFGHRRLPSDFYKRMYGR